MGMRPEHFTGIINRISNNEAMIRLLVMDKLIDIIDRHANTEDAKEIRLIFDDLRLDRGEHVFTDLVTAINKSNIAESKDLPDATKETLHNLINYIFSRK